MTWPPPLYNYIVLEDGSIYKAITTNTTTKENTMNIDATRNALVQALKEDNYDADNINDLFGRVGRYGGYRFEDVVDQADLSVTFSVTITYYGVELDGQDIDDLGNAEILKLVTDHDEDPERAIARNLCLGDDVSVCFEDSEVA